MIASVIKIPKIMPGRIIVYLRSTPYRIENRSAIRKLDGAIVGQYMDLIDKKARPTLLPGRDNSPIGAEPLFLGAGSSCRDVVYQRYLNILNDRINALAKRTGGQ